MVLVIGPKSLLCIQRLGAMQVLQQAAAEPGTVCGLWSLKNYVARVSLLSELVVTCSVVN